MKNKLLLSIIAVSMLSANAFAQSRYEEDFFVIVDKSAMKGIKKTQEFLSAELDPELATLYNKPASSQENVNQWSVGVSEIGFGGLTTAFILKDENKFIKKILPAALSLAVAADGVLRVYVAVHTENSPGLVPLLTLGAQQIQKITDEDAANLIIKAKKSYRECFAEDRSTRFTYSYKNLIAKCVSKARDIMKNEVQVLEKN